MPNVTRILSMVGSGDPDAAALLFQSVYDDLCRLAAHRLAREAPGHTLQPTDLVHEAYLRLVGGGGQRWDNRGHFFSAAAEAMRRILVECARRRRSLKHGGDRVRQNLDAADLQGPEPREDLVALDEALTQLAAADGVAAALVQLCYFGGLPIAEAARVLQVSPRTADRIWAYARSWLHRAMTTGGNPT